MLTWVEINSGAILQNLEEIKKIAGPETLIMPVIKANAYGHGLKEVAEICGRSKDAEMLCVANLDEALEVIHRVKIKKPLLVLSYYDLDEEKIAEAVRKSVRFAVYDVRQANFLQKVAKKQKKQVKAHVKVDTGAGRVGVLPSQALDFILQIRKLGNVEIEGVWSHFSSSEEDELYTERQYLAFKEVLYQLQRQGIEPKIKHVACSASLTAYPKANFNAARVGLHLYGLHPSEKTKDKINLQTALSWHTKIIQTKELPAGTKIGYGGTFTTDRRTILAVIPVGYWDGYGRSLSNKAFVLVRGKLCPVRGRICMNLSMVDVTDAPRAKAGDTVTLIGGEFNKSVTADDLAVWAGTINYEIVDKINPLLPRVVK